MEKLQQFLEYSFFTIGTYELTVVKVLGAFLVFVVARLLTWTVNRLIMRKARRQSKLDSGRRFAVVQIAKYFIYIIALLASLRTLGFNITVLLAGSTALFVGLGLGLQSTFNDFISGIIILFDGSIEVDDIIEVGDLVGRVTHIGMRTSEIITRESIGVIIPNSKITSEHVINWTHGPPITRFHVSVGVAYGSDVPLAKQVLLDCAAQHPEIIETPAPFVRFADFGDSALAFELQFWTKRTFEVEFTKSDLRYAIDEAFRKHQIQIPFPQRDLHIISDNRMQATK